MASPHKSYEQPQPWEEQKGSLTQRMVKVSREAQRIYAQQEAILPTIHHEHSVDPAIGNHLQDVGHRVQLLRENAKKPDKKALKIAEKQNPHKRVIPSRFPESNGLDDDDDDLEDDDGDKDSAMIQGQLETMLMDHEWDTRTWNSAKIHVAVETLYDQVENSDDLERRQLATKMLLRLLETHESAVDFVESTIPILMNKAFRNVSKMVNKTKLFRVCTLLSVLCEWFAPILSRDNAMGKCMKCLLREPELCARIVQHHWRGVLFERSLQKRDVDPSVRTRLRSMHFIKNVELRHQFKSLRDAMGPGGLPLEALRAYVKILFHLVKPVSSAVDKNRHYVATADQKRVLSSGILVVLASLIPNTNGREVFQESVEARRAITEHVKGIALELAICFANEADKIIEILKSNIIQRVLGDLDQQLQEMRPSGGNDGKESVFFVRSSMEVVAAIARAVWQLSTCSTQHDGHKEATDPSMMEAQFVRSRLKTTATQFLMTKQVMQTLLYVLPVARQRHDAPLCELVLFTLRYLSGSYGFASLLDALTSNGGRALEQVVLCFEYDQAPQVVRAAVALFHDMTNHADARAGFTTAGAVLLLAKWCDSGIENAKNQPRFVLALIGIALLARQHTNSSGDVPLLTSLDSPPQRVEALYATLLELVSGPSTDTQAAALYLHQTTHVFIPILLRFLVQVKPSDMEPAFQTSKQRSISAIVLSRFFQVPCVAMASFCESTVIHLALSLQCNRLDEVEGKLRKSRTTENERKLHYLALQEACKALSRLARCPTSVDVVLKPSITSVNVPLLPQAVVCDVVARMHVLEDILPLIHVPTDAAEFLDVDVAMVHAAIELIGYLRPMPYGEDARQQFLRVADSQAHPHGKFAHDKLEMLVTIAAPMVLHVLKEKNCGLALVATCCATLSRLAATNQTRTLLLNQGGLFIALTHVPEMLYDTSTSRQPKKPQLLTNGTASGDANEEVDQALYDVPASVFTFVAKLCAVADGRTAIMKAQVLPRILKRLQHTNTNRLSDDLEVKSEIAVVIQRLALCHAVEGNTSELFLHFHVLEVLIQIVIDQTTLGSPLKTTKKVKKQQHKSNGPSQSSRRHWRALHQIVGAIAALAQDVMVCVPKIVALDVLRPLGGLLCSTLDAKLNNSQEQHHIEGLHYHIVHIAWAVASYPFGEYHCYLLSVRGDGDPHATSNNNENEEHLMARIKKFAFNFTLELAGKARSVDDKQTIGELARETLSMIRERAEQLQKARERTQLPVASNVALPPQTRPGSPSLAAGKPSSPSKRQQIGGGGTFPAIPASPKRDPSDPLNWITSPSSGLASSRRCETPTRKPSQVPGGVAPIVSSPLPTVNGSLGLGLADGINLLSTRPPKPQSTSEPAHPSEYYVFARPLPQKQSRRPKPKHSTSSSQHHVGEQFLMLDPLFQSAPPPVQQQSHPHKHNSRERKASSRYTSTI